MLALIYKHPHSRLCVKPTIFLTAKHTRYNILSLPLCLMHTPLRQQFSYSSSLKFGVHAANMQIPTLRPITSPVFLRVRNSSVEKRGPRGIRSAVRKSAKGNFVICPQHWRDKIPFICPSAQQSLLLSHTNQAERNVTHVDPRTPIPSLLLLSPISANPLLQ